MRLCVCVQERLSREVGADAFVDTAALIHTDETTLWSSDQVHLRTTGYALLGSRLAEPIAAALGPQPQ